MRKTIITILLITTISLFGADVKTEQPQKNKKMIVHDMIPLPFPGGKMFKSGKITLDEKQKARLSSEVQPIMHEKYNPLVQKIFTLERSIQRDILRKENFYDAKLQKKIDTVAVMKKEALGYKLEALSKLKTIFTKEQWQVWISQ